MKLEAEFQRFNFFRVPQWRWSRVLRICDRVPSPGRCSRHDDEYVRAARNFLLTYRDAETEDVREQLWINNPGLFYAYRFHDQEQLFPEGALFLQARLLARQPHDKIAKEMTTCTEAVHWYEALFFDVTPYLDCRDWITSRILIPAFQKKLDIAPGVHNEDDNVNVSPFRDSTVAKPFMDASLKLFAYFGGMNLVDIMIHSMQSGKPLTSMEDLPNWFDYHWSTTVRRRSAQAAGQFEINKYNVMELFAVHTQIMALERSEDSADQRKTETERHIKAMIDEIPWAVGEQGEKLFSGTMLGHLDNMPAELRDEEVLKIASGEKVPGMNENWPDKLPPPRKKDAHVLSEEKITLK